MHLEKRVLVTGGAGFLGSHLLDRLVETGAHVICVDNFYTGAHRNISHLLGRKNFEVIRHDVCFPLYVEVDEIYNLDCPASPGHYPNYKDKRVGRNQHARACQACSRKDIPGVDIGGVRRSERTPATGVVLGQC